MMPLVASTLAIWVTSHSPEVIHIGVDVLIGLKKAIWLYPSYGTTSK